MARWQVWVISVSLQSVEMKDLVTSHKLSNHGQERFSLFNEKAGFRWSFLTTVSCTFVHVFSQHDLPEATLHSSSVCLRFLLPRRISRYFSNIFFWVFSVPQSKLTCHVLIFLSTLASIAFDEKSAIPQWNRLLFFYWFQQFYFSLAFNILMSLGVNLSYVEFIELLRNIDECSSSNLGSFQPLFLWIYFCSFLSPLLRVLSLCVCWTFNDVPPSWGFSFFFFSSCSLHCIVCSSDIRVADSPFCRFKSTAEPL